MANNIRKYGPMMLTAYVGKDGSKCIQFTIGENYALLDGPALLDLRRTINRRLALYDGYTATGKEREDIQYGQTVE
jgi:hypothetical protein